MLLWLTNQLSDGQIYSSCIPTYPINLLSILLQLECVFFYVKVSFHIFHLIYICFKNHLIAILIHLFLSLAPYFVEFFKYQQYYLHTNWLPNLLSLVLRFSLALKVYFQLIISLFYPKFQRKFKYKTFDKVISHSRGMSFFYNFYFSFKT